jgi:iron(III) transport system ATP-binding protein
VGLAGFGRRYPHQLSGGQQQRVALARALAIRPGLVLLDEPFSSLDASLRASVRADVRKVLRDAGTTGLLVTHDQEEALSLADEVAVIREGCIGQVDTPEGLYRRPRSPELARAFGETNLLAGVARGGVVATALGELALEEPHGTDGTVLEVLVRPEQVEFSTEPDATGLRGHVVEFEFYGHDAVVRIQPDAAPTGLLVARTTKLTETLGIGTPVHVWAKGAVVAWNDPRDPAELAAEARSSARLLR